MAYFDKQFFEFLDNLKKNNNRDWFQANKSEYTKAHDKMIAFADNLLLNMNKHDNIENETGKKSLHRIYNDVRFRKDKTPYKYHFSGFFKRKTKLLRGGYYFHIEEGNSFLGGGFWAPEPDDLKRIREDIAADDSYLNDIITSKKFTSYFEELRGEQLKTAPKGFPKDHKAIELLRYKQFLIKHDFTDAEVKSNDVVDLFNEGFKNMRPFFDYMSDVLTTNLNGERIV